MTEQKYTLTNEIWMLDSDEEPQARSKEERKVRRAIKIGSWSEQEKAFANKLIEDFKAGVLKDCAVGTRLTPYLAGKLGCDVSKLTLSKRPEPELLLVDLPKVDVVIPKTVEIVKASSHPPPFVAPNTKWTKEEEQLALSYIQKFKDGTATDCKEGLTLRAYLAQCFNCDPRRITTKFQPNPAYDGFLRFASAVSVDSKTENENKLQDKVTKPAIPTSTSSSPSRRVVSAVGSDSSSLPRVGKFQPAEETLCSTLIPAFKAGTLDDCDEGISIWSYLGRKLNCAPRRVMEKYGGGYVGPSTFISRPSPPPVPATAAASSAATTSTSSNKKKGILSINEATLKSKSSSIADHTNSGDHNDTRDHEEKEARKNEGKINDKSNTKQPQIQAQRIQESSRVSRQAAGGSVANPVVTSLTPLAPPLAPPANSRQSWDPKQVTLARSLIKDFLAGVLPDCSEGIHMLSYLEGKLGCARKRILNKFGSEVSFRNALYKPKGESKRSAPVKNATTSSYSKSTRTSSVPPPLPPPPPPPLPLPLPLAVVSSKKGTVVSNNKAAGIAADPGSDDKEEEDDEEASPLPTTATANAALNTTNDDVNPVETSLTPLAPPANSRQSWDPKQVTLARSLIADFVAGVLPDCSEGIHMLSYLEGKLGCGRKRILNKFGSEVSFRNALYVAKNAQKSGGTGSSSRQKNDRVNNAAADNVTAAPSDSSNRKLTRVSFAPPSAPPPSAVVNSNKDNVDDISSGRKNDEAIEAAEAAEAEDHQRKTTNAANKQIKAITTVTATEADNSPSSYNKYTSNRPYAWNPTDAQYGYDLIHTFTTGSFPLRPPSHPSSSSSSSSSSTAASKDHIPYTGEKLVDFLARIFDCPTKRITNKFSKVSFRDNVYKPSDSNNTDTQTTQKKKQKDTEDILKAPQSPRSHQLIVSGGDMTDDPLLTAASASKSNNNNNNNSIKKVMKRKRRSREVTFEDHDNQDEDNQDDDNDQPVVDGLLMTSSNSSNKRAKIPEKDDKAEEKKEEVRIESSASIEITVLPLIPPTTTSPTKTTHPLATSPPPVINKAGVDRAAAARAAKAASHAAKKIKLLQEEKEKEMESVPVTKESSRGSSSFDHLLSAALEQEPLPLPLLSTRSDNPFDDTDDYGNPLLLQQAQAAHRQQQEEEAEEDMTVMKKKRGRPPKYPPSIPPQQPLQGGQQQLQQSSAVAAFLAKKHHTGGGSGLNRPRSRDDLLTMTDSQYDYDNSMNDHYDYDRYSSHSHHEQQWPPPRQQEEPEEEEDEDEQQHTAGKEGGRRSKRRRRMPKSLHEFVDPDQAVRATNHQYEHPPPVMMSMNRGDARGAGGGGGRPGYHASAGSMHPPSMYAGNRQQQQSTAAGASSVPMTAAMIPGTLPPNMTAMSANNPQYIQKLAQEHWQRFTATGPYRGGESTRESQHRAAMQIVGMAFPHFPVAASGGPSAPRSGNGVSSNGAGLAASRTMTSLLGSASTAAAGSKLLPTLPPLPPSCSSAITAAANVMIAEDEDTGSSIGEDYIDTTNQDEHAATAKVLATLKQMMTTRQSSTESSSSSSSHPHPAAIESAEQAKATIMQLLEYLRQPGLFASRAIIAQAEELLVSAKRELR